MRLKQDSPQNDIILSWNIGISCIVVGKEQRKWILQTKTSFQDCGLLCSLTTWNVFSCPFFLLNDLLGRSELKTLDNIWN